MEEITVELVFGVKAGIVWKATGSLQNSTEEQWYSHWDNSNDLMIMGRSIGRKGANRLRNREAKVQW